MSGFIHNHHEHHEQRRESRHERREERREERHGGYSDEREHPHHQQTLNYQSPPHLPPQSAYQAQGGYHGQGGYQSQGGYQAPSGPPPSVRGPRQDRDFDRGDFTSDADFNTMMAAGAFREAPRERYGEREPQRGEYGRYDAPPGPPQGRQYDRDTYGSGDRQQYAPSSPAPPHYGQSNQGRGQYGGGEGRDNVPSGGFMSSGGAARDEEKYGGFDQRRGEEPPRRGEADSYYNPQGQAGRNNNPHAQLAGMAQAHGAGDDDHEVYHQATQGLQERIRPQHQDEEPDYKAHVDAHRKAYGDDDSHGPLDANTIGAAAAMEAIKQTANAGGNAPSGGFLGGKPSGGRPSRPQAEDEEEEDTEPAGGSGGGLQDKIMALAMAHAGSLFDKKNGGSASASGSQDKAQAMQSAAATAMQMFAQYKTKGKLEPTDMQKVMGLAMNLF